MFAYEMPELFFCRWVFLAMLIMIGALVPKDRFELTPSIVMSSAVWAVLLHPGSTNSSGVVRVAAAALDLLMRRQHPLDIEAAEAAEKEAVAAEKSEAEAAAEAGEEAAPLKKRKFSLPPQRQILAGGGSLAAVGARTLNCCLHIFMCLRCTSCCAFIRVTSLSIIRHADESRDEPGGCSFLRA